MSKITLQKSGPIYPVWLMVYNYLHFELEPELPLEVDLGLRITKINQSFFAIESFLKDSLIHFVQSDLTFPLNAYFARGKKYKSDVTIQSNNFTQAEIIRDFTWGRLKVISKELGNPIKDIPNHEFVVNLYLLRNGLVHGNYIEILKSHTLLSTDELYKPYYKALEYFGNEGVINIRDIIDSQDIYKLLNKKLTDFIIENMKKVLNDIVTLYPEGLTATKWKEIGTL